VCQDDWLRLVADGVKIRSTSAYVHVNLGRGPASCKPQKEVHAGDKRGSTALMACSWKRCLVEPGESV
jgi:hypothetical protein